MTISARSILMAGATVVTASAVLIAPSVEPLPAPRPAIELTASVQQVAAPLAQPAFDPFAFLIGIPPSLSRPFPTPGNAPIPTPGSIGTSIQNIYNSVEFWVDYGFEVGAWAFGWVPWIGWLAPQIWPIGYNLGESIVRTIVFNITDWLNGDVSFGEGLVNVGEDTIRAFVNFGIAEWNFWLPSLPIPPLPGILNAPAQATALADAGTDNAGLLGGLFNRVLNPFNTGGGLGGTSLGSPFTNGLRGFGDLLGDPLSPPDEAKVSEVGTIPAILKTPFTPLKDLRGNVDTADQTAAGPLSEVTKTVRNVRNELRTGFNATNQGAVGAKDVGAQDKVRNPVANAANNIVNAVRAAKPGKPGADATNAPSTVAKSLGDSARNAVKQVRQAAKNARGAANDRPAANNRPADHKDE